MMKSKPKVVFKGFVFAFLATTLGSFGPLFFRKVITSMNIEIAVMCLLFLGSITMFFVGIFKERKSKKMFAKIFRLNILLRLGALGFFTAAFYIFYALAMKAASVTEASILIRIDPIFVVLFSSIFLGEKIRNWGLVFVAVAFCFCGMAVFQEVNYSNFGKINSLFILLGVLTALALSMQYIIMGYIQKHDNISEELIISVGNFIGALLLFVHIVNMGIPISVPIWNNLVVLFFLGFVTIALVNRLYLEAYRIIGSMGRISFVDYLNPLTTGAIAYYVNNERGFRYENLFFGFILISIGVYIINKSIAHEYEGK